MRIASIKVGPMQVSVTSTADLNAIGMYHNHPTHHIETLEGIGDVELNSVLIHESLEAMNRMYGIGLLERQICALETSLFAWVRDNPALIEAIRKAGK